MSERALPLLDAAAGAGTRAAVASQWQLMWWAFVRHRLAVLALGVIALLYLVALICEFVAPADPVKQDRRAVYQPPQRLHLLDRTEEGTALRPFVYKMKRRRDPETLKVTYDRTEKKIYLTLLGRGDRYRLWGLFESDLHLIAAKKKGERFFLLGADRLGLDYPVRKGFLQRVTGSLRAVDDVSFELAEGESLGIVGESGSGKTSLGRCVVRALEPSAGGIHYRRADGGWCDLARAKARTLRPLRREIRMIFQDPYASLNPRMTIEQIVGEPLLVNGIASGSELADRVAALLRTVGLAPEMMERYPHAFSGGQRQRIVIARSIALDPRLIVADEPTSALDVSIRSQVLDLLLELQAKLGLSFLLISHDMSVVRYFCDRIGVMYRGRIVEIGDCERVITAPEHPYTKALLSAVPHPDPGRRSIGDRIHYHPDETR